MTNKNPKEKIELSDKKSSVTNASHLEELKKGCGKIIEYLNNGFNIRCGSFKKSPDDVACGEYNIFLCPICQAKLTTLQEAQKEFMEMIDVLDNPEIIANWGKTEQERLVIMKYVKAFKQELLSKLGGQGK